MSVLKVKKNGVWVDTVGTISDADTLDGRHADAFALANDVDELRALVNSIEMPEQFVVTISENDGTYSADKAFVDTYTAIVSGKDVVFKSEVNTYLQMLMYDETFIVLYSDMHWFWNASLSEMFVFKNDNSIEHTTESKSFLPDVTEADNGKVLVVENGKWVAKSMS